MVFASKFLPTIARWSRSSFHNALRRSCERLGSTCDIYFLHTPIHPLPLEFWISCACEAAKAAGQDLTRIFFPLIWSESWKKLLREVHETYLQSFQGFIFFRKWIHEHLWKSKIYALIAIHDLSFRDYQEFMEHIYQWSSTFSIIHQF